LDGRKSRLDRSRVTAEGGYNRLKIALRDGLDEIRICEQSV